MSEQRLLRLAKSAVATLQSKSELTSASSTDYEKNDLFYVLDEDSLYRCTVDNNNVKIDSDFVSTRIPKNADIITAMKPSFDSEQVERLAIEVYNLSRFDKVDAEKVALNAKADSETLARTADITKIDVGVDSDEVYYKAVVKDFQAQIDAILSQIDSDKAASTAGFNAKLAAEQIDRLAADTLMTTLLDSETALRDTQTDEFDTNLKAEIATRTSNDDTIKANTTSAIADYNAKINVEKVRIDEILDNTSGDLDTLKEIGEAFQAADTQTQNLITLNTGKISKASGHIDSDFTEFAGEITTKEAEIKSVTDVRDSIISKIDSEIVLRVIKTTNLNGRITQEIADREVSMKVLTDKIAKEIADRTAEGVRLLALIDSEINIRAIADSEIRTTIDTKVAAAQAYNTALETSTNNSITDYTNTLLSNDSDLINDRITEWNIGVSYKSGQVVISDSDSEDALGHYLAISDHTSSASNKPGKDGTALWQFIKSQAGEELFTGGNPYFIPSVNKLTVLSIDADSEGDWIDIDSEAKAAPAGTIANVYSTKLIEYDSLYHVGGDDFLMRNHWWYNGIGEQKGFHFTDAVANSLISTPDGTVFNETNITTNAQVLPLVEAKISGGAVSNKGTQLITKEHADGDGNFWFVMYEGGWTKGFHLKWRWSSDWMQFYIVSANYKSGDWTDPSLPFEGVSTMKYSLYFNSAAGGYCLYDMKLKNISVKYGSTNTSVYSKLGKPGQTGLLNTTTGTGAWHKLI